MKAIEIKKYLDQFTDEQLEQMTVMGAGQNIFYFAPFFENKEIINESN